MPSKHILVVEDDLLQQVLFGRYFLKLYGHQSEVKINFAASAIDAHNIIFSDNPPDLIILDHDLQHGNGVELLSNMRNSNINISVITASGMPANNERLMHAGANYKFIKNDIISGQATDICLQVDAVALSGTGTA